MWQVKQQFWHSRQHLLWVKSLTWAHSSPLLLPGASLGHMGPVQPEREIRGLYLCLLKVLDGKINQMVCTFKAQGFVSALFRS